MKTARKGKQIKPLLREGSKLLFLYDYPSVKDIDAGVVMSGSTPRQAFFGWLCDEIGLDINKVSFATTMGCVIESRGIITVTDMINCSKNVIDLINENEIEYVLIFGSAAYTALTNITVPNLDKERGLFKDLPGTKAKGVITYALNSIVDGEGCGSCGRSVYKMLARKDAGIILRDVMRYGKTI